MHQLRIPVRIRLTPDVAILSATESVWDVLSPGGIRWETGWQGLVNGLISSEAELARVRSLREEAYVANGVPSAKDLIGDDFDRDPNTKIFVLQDSARALGTVRVSTCPPRTSSFLSQCFNEFPAYVKRDNYLEVTHFAIRPSAASGDPRFVLSLIQNVTAEADRHGARYIVAPISTKHWSFYGSIGFKQISRERWMSRWSYPVILGCLDWPAERNRLRRDPSFHHVFTARNPVGESPSSAR